MRFNNYEGTIIYKKFDVVLPQNKYGFHSKKHKNTLILRVL